MTRGLALRLVRGWAAPELEPTLARASALCHELNDPPELFPVMWNVAFFNLLRGHLSLVQEQVETMMAQAGAAAEPLRSAFEMSACHIAGVTCEFLGDVRRSHELLERARALHDPARHAEYNAMFGMDPGMVARAMSCRPLFALGYPDRALERSRETIEISRSQRQPVTFTFALILSQGIHLYRGEAADAIALGDQSIALCQEYEFAQEIEWARAFQGAAYSLAGEVERGAAELEASLIAQKALRTGLVRTMFLSLLAESYRRAGRIEEGLRVVDEGFSYAEASGEHGFDHELHRVRGELQLATGRVTEAEASFRAAVAEARRRDARSFELRAATCLARLLAASGRADEARATLAPVLDWFTSGQNTADLSAARELIDELHATT
jgi:predicted ATPase